MSCSRRINLNNDLDRNIVNFGRGLGSVIHSKRKIKKFNNRDDDRVSSMLFTLFQMNGESEGKLPYEASIILKQIISFQMEMDVFQY